MSCNYCYLDEINRRHFPLRCSICHSKSFQFVPKCDCYGQCGHAFVPVCENDHINRPILTKTCRNAFLSDEMALLLLKGDKQ